MIVEPGTQITGAQKILLLFLASFHLLFAYMILDGLVHTDTSSGFAYGFGMLGYMVMGVVDIILFLLFAITKQWQQAKYTALILLAPLALIVPVMIVQYIRLNT